MPRLIATLAALLLTACSQADAEPAGSTDEVRTAPAARATRVEVATINLTRPKLELRLPGEVEGSKDARLASPMGGYVEQVMVQDGARVNAGRPIALINAATLQAQREQVSVALEQARTDLELVERAGSSLPVSRRNAAKFAVKSAEAAFKIADLNASRATVKAPFSGIVAKVDIEQGEVLPPGGVVARLVKLNPIKVSISVADRDIGTLSEGMAVSVTTESHPAPIEGRIDRISPAADINTRTFLVDVELPNSNRALLPGMIATVRIGVELQQDTLALPQHVLVTRRAGNGVFVEEAGVARWRPLRLGRIIRDQILIEEGLSPGERVIVTGHRELVDGDAVIVGRTGECCTEGRIVFPGE